MLASCAGQKMAYLLTAAQVLPGFLCLLVVLVLPEDLITEEAPRVSCLGGPFTDMGGPHSETFGHPQRPDSDTHFLNIYFGIFTIKSTSLEHLK